MNTALSMTVGVRMFMPRNVLIGRRHSTAPSSGCTPQSSMRVCTTSWLVSASRAQTGDENALPIMPALSSSVRHTVSPVFLSSLTNEPPA